MLSSILLGLALGLGLTLVANFATTVYLHRGLAHRALNVSTPLSVVFRFMIWIMTGIRPRQWAAVHRKHHAFTDQPEDPHSPAILGWVRVQLTNVALYRKVANDRSQVDKFARDLPATKLDRYVLDHAVIGLALGVAGLLLLFDPLLAIVAAISHAVFYLGLSGTVNSVGHTFGARPYDNSATNLQWLAVLTAGEGFHNNHHAAPTSARFSLNRGEWDPAWLPIKVFRRLGLVSIRHDTPVFARTSG